MPQNWVPGCTPALTSPAGSCSRTPHCVTSLACLGLGCSSRFCRLPQSLCSICTVLKATAHHVAPGHQSVGATHLARCTKRHAPEHCTVAWRLELIAVLAGILQAEHQPGRVLCRRRNPLLHSDHLRHLQVTGCVRCLFEVLPKSQVGEVDKTKRRGRGLAQI